MLCSLMFLQIRKTKFKQFLYLLDKLLKKDNLSSFNLYPLYFCNNLLFYFLIYLILYNYV